MSFRILGGLYRGRTLHSPKGTQTRPTSGRVREAVFNICKDSIEEAIFLDLFAGSGAMGFEALSRKAKFVTFVDSSPLATKCIEQNRKTLSVLSSSEVLSMDISKALRKLEKDLTKHFLYTLVYIDPPYSSLSLLEKTLHELNQSSLLQDNAYIFIEQSYEKKITFPPFSNLSILSSRKLGNASLEQFVYKKPVA